MTKEYIGELWSTFSMLEKTKETVFENIIDLAIKGELKDFFNDLPKGIKIDFRLDDFCHLEDQRIKDLYNLIEILEEKRENILSAFEFERNLDPDFDDLPF